MMKLVSLLVSLFIAMNAYAQTSRGSRTNTPSELDSLLSDSAPAEADTVSEPTPENPESVPQVQAPPPPEPTKDVKVEPGKLSNLANLAPHEDIVVLQRKFLPRTGRLELAPSLGMIINNAFFTSFAFNGRIGYAFSEKYSVEAQVAQLGSNERQITSDLRTKRDVITRTLVNPELYYGLDFRWTPLYGKFARLGTGIVPFELFFVGGAGVTKTNQDESPVTIHLGTGQLFAWKKWMAFRWDLGWYMYNLRGGAGRPSGNFTDVQLSFGVSFFVPQAGYR